MSEYLIERIAEQPAIEVLYQAAVEAVEECGRLEQVVVRDPMGSRRTLQAAALFVLIGAEPDTQWLRGAIELDTDGFILTGAGLAPTAERQPPWDGMQRLQAHNRCVRLRHGRALPAGRRAVNPRPPGIDGL
jgi:thioredoxin reductase (NADPH)